MGTQPESKLSRAIITMIRARGGYAVKFHGGPMTEAGTPDILACIRVHLPDEWGERHEDSPQVGLFVGIETKMPGKRDNVSIIQEHRHGQIRKAGGIVLVVTSVQEAVQALENLGMPIPTPDGDSSV
jgi:hypothetical protein